MGEDGGTRYVKQCVDQGPRAQGCPPDAAQTCNAIGGGKHKSCRKCDRSDLCNDELDEGEDPSEIVVPENESGEYSSAADLDQPKIGNWSWSDADLVSSNKFG